VKFTNRKRVFKIIPFLLLGFSLFIFWLKLPLGKFYLRLNPSASNLTISFENQPEIKTEDFSFLSNNQVVYQEDENGIGYCFGFSSESFTSDRLEFCPLVSGISLISNGQKGELTNLKIEGTFFQQLEFGPSLTQETIIPKNRNLLLKRFIFKKKTKPKLTFNLNFPQSQEDQKVGLRVWREQGSTFFEKNGWSVGFKTLFGKEQELALFDQAGELLFRGDLDRVVNLNTEEDKFKIEISFAKDNLLSFGISIGKNKEATARPLLEPTSFTEWLERTRRQWSRQTRLLVNSQFNRGLDDWIHFLELQLVGHQDNENGSIALGLPAKDGASYWSVFPKEMSIYTYALIESGFFNEALKAIRFLAQVQRQEGFWQTRNYMDGKVLEDSTGNHWPGEADTSVFMPVILVASYWRATNQSKVLREFYPMISTSLNYAIDNLYDQEKGVFKGRLNDNDPQNTKYTPASEEWLYHFYNSFTALQAFRDGASIAYKLRFKDDFSRFSDISRQVEKNINWFYSKEQSSYLHRRVSFTWQEDFKDITQHWEIDGEIKNLDNFLIIMPGSRAYTKYGKYGVNLFGDLSLKLNLSRNSQGFRFGFVSLDGRSLVALRVDRGKIYAELADQGKRFEREVGEIEMDKEVELTVSWKEERVSWIKDGQTLFESQEKSFIPQSGLPIWLSLSANNGQKSRAIVKELVYNNGFDDADWLGGVSSRFAEPLLWLQQIPDNSRNKYLSTINSLINQLKTKENLIAMATNGYLPGCGAQQTGQVIAGLAFLGLGNQGIELLENQKELASTFGALPEYSCDGKPAGLSFNDSWAAANTIIGYYRLFGITRFDWGLRIQPRVKPYKVLNYLHRGKVFNIEVKGEGDCISEFSLNGFTKKLSNCKNYLDIRNTLFPINNVKIRFND